MFDCSDSRMIHMMKTNPSESAIKTQDTRMGEDFHSILEEYQGLWKDVFKLDQRYPG